MSHLPFAITAYFLNGIAVTIDKFLLNKQIPDPLTYVFYFSLISLGALLFIPFVEAPALSIILIASLSTLIWTIGAYFMFKALQIGQVSRVIPVIGTLIPVFLLIKGIITSSISSGQITAILFLVTGLICITIFDWQGKLNKKEIVLELLAAFFLAASYLILREAYTGGDSFLNVFIYSKPVLIPLGLILVLIPQTRKRIFTKKTNESHHSVFSFIKSKAILLFGLGQISAGVSELLIAFSVSLAEPALVNSLQGTQYVFLFFLNWGLSKKYPAIFSEDLVPKLLLAKFLGIALIGVGLYVLAVS
jgi:hypothetical protein